MMIANVIAAAAALALGLASVAGGQGKQAVEPVAAPPKLLVLVYQRFSFDKGSERDKWEIEIARACRKLDVPNSWIVMESVTGEPELLSFDPFDSFAQMEKPLAEWGPIYAAHPELGRLQAEINAALTSQRTVIAVRRDDLSHRAKAMDLSKARYMRVVELRLHPGRENEVAAAIRKLSPAIGTTESDLPWVVYQVEMGMPAPAYLVFAPMSSLGQNDELLKLRETAHAAESEAAEGTSRGEREACARMESNLYSIHPEKSHVSKEFAAGDPEFWTPKPQAPAKPVQSKAGNAKGRDTKPKE